MPPSVADAYVILKERKQWPDPRKPKTGLSRRSKRWPENVPGNAFEFSQPIQLRFNELISGVRSDLGVKVYGDDLEQLLTPGEEIAKVLNSVPGAQA